LNTSIFKPKDTQPKDVSVHPNKLAMPSFTHMQERAKKNLESEIKRIVALPITKPLTEEEIETISWLYLSEDAFKRGERLRAEQALAMVHYNEYGGIFATLGVGGGKTLISFMVANDCYKKTIKARQEGNLDKEPRILLVIQANLIEKFENDAPAMREFLKEIPPYFIMKGSNKRQRTMLAKSGRRGLYVCSYHTLSSKDATDILEAINPCCIICDEAQNVAGTKSSARANRFRSFVSQHQPEVIPLSGTMTRKSVMEYFFLAKHALGKYNFLPNSSGMAEEWAGALDSSAPNMSAFRNDNRPRPGPIKHLITWCHANFRGVDLPPNLVGFRRAFAKRMGSAPGVIKSTVKDPVGSGLIFSNNQIEDKESREGWQKLQDHLEVLVEDFQTPSGLELTCAMNVWGYRYQMEATGFYYDLYWREPEELAKVRKISVVEATRILDKSRALHELHKQYQAALRWWIKNNSRPKLDTPALIGINMYNHGDKHVGPTLYIAWKAWKDYMFDEVEVRQQRPVRVCDFKVKAVADDAQKDGKGGIIWYTHAEMGVWMMDVLKERGIEAIHCPRGDWANKLLADSSKLKGKLIVASLTAHSTGKDLQFGFCNNYYLQSPVSATTAEQSMGRTHRPGQKADEVTAKFYLATDFDHAHFNGLLNDTAYVQQSTGGFMKLLIGSYTFKPKSVPYTALQEMGATAKKLDRDGQKLIDKIVDKPALKMFKR